ncbi:MAG TPA: two-component regulator propeller domain-containing protein, partial [Bryobacteraceae bacterium]|nr:two-component regulator propeller domain-containing protein [Bryobacteraceae bacterium]
DPNSLPQNDVETLFADREGSVWGALGRMGVTHFAANPLPFKRIPHLASAEGTPEPFVGAIYADRQGILWIGTPEALNRIDRKAGHYNSYRRRAGPATRTDVIAIREDRSGTLWVGTYNHGLLRLDQRTGHFKAYLHDPADPYSLSNDIVTRLLVDHNGTLWVATDDGLNRFNAATGRFTVYKLDPQRRMSYLELVEDRKGALWLGTDSSGLYHFDPATGQLTKYEHDINRSGSLSDSRVNSVHFDRSDTMWVGTQNGLDKFDSKTGTFTVYTRRDGLPGNAVGCILEDDHKDLWMSTNNGIARFDPQTAGVRSYSTAEGLPGLDLTGWGACFKNPGGEMFFGGFNGATFFHPDTVVGTSYTPPVVLTEFLLSGSPVDIGSGSPLSKAITYTTRLTLSHEQRIFSLAFSALSYFRPGATRYRYKLEGLDKTWHEVGSDERLATYTTLPAGVYTFRVQGATSRGPWTEPGAQLSIEILPPWWGTLSFRVSFGVVALLVGLAAYNYRLHQIARAITARFDERLAERTRIARELHDNLLQNLAGISLQLDGIAKQVAYHPEKTVPLIGKVREQVDASFQEARVQVWNLRSTSLEGPGLAVTLQQFCERIGPSTTARCEFQLVGQPRPLPAEFEEELLRIAQEATHNAVRHAHSNQIRVVLEYAVKWLRLSICDDGQGFDLQEGLRKADHWGLKNMQERAAQIHATCEITSSAGNGTRVQVDVPLSLKRWRLAIT